MTRVRVMRMLGWLGVLWCATGIVLGDAWVILTGGLLTIAAAIDEMVTRGDL